MRRRELLKSIVGAAAAAVTMPLARVVGHEADPAPAAQAPAGDWRDNVAVAVDKSGKKITWKEWKEINCRFDEAIQQFRDDEVHSDGDLDDDFDDWDDYDCGPVGSKELDFGGPVGGPPAKTVTVTSAPRKLTPDDIQDLVNATLKDLQRQRWKDLAKDIEAHKKVAERWFKFDSFPHFPYPSAYADHLKAVADKDRVTPSPAMAGPPPRSGEPAANSALRHVHSFGFEDFPIRKFEWFPVGEKLPSVTAILNKMAVSVPPTIAYSNPAIMHKNIC